MWRGIWLSFHLLDRFVSPFWRIRKGCHRQFIVNSDGIDTGLNVVEWKGPKTNLDNCRFDGGYEMGDPMRGRRRMGRECSCIFDRTTHIAAGFYRSSAECLVRWRRNSDSAASLRAWGTLVPGPQVSMFSAVITWSRIWDHILLSWNQKWKDVKCHRKSFHPTINFTA